MIRRETTLADGRPGWLLISQIEHARISAELAAACVPDALLPARDGGNGASPRAAPLQKSHDADLVAVRAEVLAAIAAHDDGWRQWESSPGLDADGRPRSFTELPLVEALRIWSASIAAAATIGPLAAWMIAGHFRRLLDHSESLGREPLADLWRATHDRPRELRLDEWQFADPLVRTRALADAALAALRTFDAASLWFCCGCGGFDGARQDEEAISCSPLKLELVGGATTTLRSAPGGATADPWPFTPPELTLIAPALLVPARRHGSASELLAAAAPCELRWTLRSR
ncbi:MAG: DUF3891 family protein [Pirellulales bacterium]|nr:DUF3891 family protein [Pirellulales bacterium]